MRQLNRDAVCCGASVVNGTSRHSWHVPDLSAIGVTDGANVKKRATLVRGPKTTQQYKSLYWAELGLGALGPGQKAFNSITQIGVLSSLVLAPFDP